MNMNDDILVQRFAKFVEKWNPYRPGMDPYKIMDLLEGKAGPKEHHVPQARNERRWTWLHKRLTLYVVWGVNWVLEFSVFGDRDDGFIDLGLGPYRLAVYARWGLTEDERIATWAQTRPDHW